MRLKLAVSVSLWVPLVAGCALVGRRDPAAAQVSAARELSMQGIAAMERGEWDRAESLLRKSLETTPADSESRRCLAESLWNRGATKEAITQIVAAAQADPSDAPLAVRAGEMLLAVGATERALSQAEQAIRTDPSLSSAWALRGRTYWHLHQPERALADLHHALETAPNNRDILLDVAAIDRQLGQPARCLTTLHRLLDTYSPGEEPQAALVMEGLTLHELGRSRQAAELLAAASRRSPPSAATFCALAQVQAALGEFDAAADNARRALAIDGAHVPSQQLLTQLASRPATPTIERR